MDFFRNALVSFQVLGDLPIVFFILVSSLIPLQSENTLDDLNYLKFV